MAEGVFGVIPKGKARVKGNEFTGQGEISEMMKTCHVTFGKGIPFLEKCLIFLLSRR